MATQAQIAAVQQLYIGYLGRAADKAGLDFWTNAVATGVSTLESVATGFTLSNEYKAAFGGLTNDALVEKVYTSVLGRASDTAGKAFWVDALAKGTVTADKLVATFIGALGAPDQTIINNKTFVAQTYTDTVGAEYNATAGASVIAGVDGSAASVTAALANISNGTLTGLVPGVALINAVAAANAAVTAYEKSVATTNPTFDTLNGAVAGKDGAVTSAEATTAAEKATEARFDTMKGGVSALTTAVLTDDATTKAALASSSKTIVLNTTGGPAALAALDQAVAAQKALVGNTAATATKTALEVATENASTAATAALAGVDAAAKAGTLTTYEKLSEAFGATPIDSVSSLKDALISAPSIGKSALLTELQKVTTYGQQAIDTVAKQAAFIKAAKDIEDAKDSAVLKGTDNYITKANSADDAAALLVKAQAADVAVAAAKVVVDKFAALKNGTDVAAAALKTFADANSEKVLIKEVSAGGNVEASAKADVFYFGSKLDATKDFNLGTATHFGAGDSIVLGSNYTFNSGALSTGNGNALEFFLVKGSTGTQVVIETEAYGSSAAGTVVDASGNVTDSPAATVINLVGVTADHLSVNNGVISYV